MSGNKTALVTCAYCCKPVHKRPCDVQRSERAGMFIYCNRECSALARRSNKTDTEKRAEKAAYDAEYRIKNLEKRKAQKAAYYQRTRDPEKEAKKRKERMPLHVEYCRRPEYRAWKSEYDRKYRARKDYGEFADAFLALLDVESELDSQATNYERRLHNGTYNKARTRRRAACLKN